MDESLQLEIEAPRAPADIEDAREADTDVDATGTGLSPDGGSFTIHRSALDVPALSFTSLRSMGDVDADTFAPSSTLYSPRSHGSEDDDDDDDSDGHGEDDNEDGDGGNDGVDLGDGGDDAKLTRRHQEDSDGDREEEDGHGSGDDRNAIAESKSAPDCDFDVAMKHSSKDNDDDLEDEKDDTKQSVLVQRDVPSDRAREAVTTNVRAQHKRSEVDIKVSHLKDDVELAMSEKTNADTRPSQVLQNCHDAADDMATECGSPRDALAAPEESVDPVGADRTREHTGAPAAVHPMPSMDASLRPPPTPTVNPAYTVKALFPIVFEKEHTKLELSAAKMIVPAATSRQVQACDVVTSSETPDASTSESKQPPPPLAEKRVGVLQAQVNSLQEQLQRVTRTLQLQLNVCDNERKQLAQRNLRLKTQMVTLATDLTRTKAECSKLTTENELYAAKLPKLQAELSEETSLVDEKHAASIQSHLEVAQLRAKAQVLQTRSGNLDQQVEKLTQELRTTKKELRRKVASLQQQEEKTHKFETELNELRRLHAQDLLNAKNKLSATTHRLEQERAKREATWKRSIQQHTNDAKTAAAKSLKARKELELRVSSLEQQLIQVKVECEEKEQEMRRLGREVASGQSLLYKADRSENSWRDQVNKLQLQLRALEQEKKKLIAANVPKRRPIAHRPTNRYAFEDLGEQVFVCDEDVDSRRCLQSPRARFCVACSAAISDGGDSFSSARATPGDCEECSKCPALQNELESAHDELARVRLLHTSELKVQASAYERVLTSLRRLAPPHGTECA